MLIHSRLSASDQALADKCCLIHGDRHFTYRAFAWQVDEWAARLAKQINKGDRVLLKQADPVAQLLYFFAVVKAGGSCVFIDAAASEAVCQELISRHGIALYIDEQYELPATAATCLPAIVEDDLFLGALSSGSTGEPKLIWRDHRSWTSAFAAQSEVFHLSGDDTLFLAGSLVYTANLNACLHMLFLGGTVVIGAGVRPRTWVQEMLARQVSAVCMVPAHYNLLLKAIPGALTRVRSLVAAGAKLAPDTVRQLLAHFPQADIYAYYGASELGHVSYMTGEDLLKNPEAAGKPFPGVKITIEDAEIWVQSPYLAPACRPKATAGDLGRTDEWGYLYVLGRKNGLINSGGVKVIPEQVETILCQCPGIAQAAVGGVADENKGQRVCAWVVRNQPGLSVADILAFCRQKLRPHYCPQKIIFVDALPLNTSGKIDRLRLALRS